MSHRTTWCKVIDVAVFYSRILTIWNKKFVLYFSIFEFLFIFIFFLYELEGAIAPIALPLKPPVFMQLPAVASLYHAITSCLENCVQKKILEKRGGLKPEYVQFSVIVTLSNIVTKVVPL